MLRDMRVSVMMKADITRIQGNNKIDAVYFKKPKAEGKEKLIEYYIKPDVVIAENGIGSPKYDI